MYGGSGIPGGGGTPSAPPPMQYNSGTPMYGPPGGAVGGAGTPYSTGGTPIGGPPPPRPGLVHQASTLSIGSTTSGGGGSIGGFKPGSCANATSIVELSISGRKLRDMDVFSKSDPMCVVFVKPFGGGHWREFARTETIMNNLNPDFATKVTMAYTFEQQQKIRFVVYDIDNKSARLQDHDFIGCCETTLGQIVSSGGGAASSGAGMTMELRHEDGSAAGGIRLGQLIVTSEELSTCKDELELQFSGHKLDKKDWFGSSDPFLQISKSNEGGGSKFTLVHRTEHINNNVNPLWKRFVVPVRTLCNGDLDRNLKFEVFDHNKSGNHSNIGEFFATTRNLIEQQGTSFSCINLKKKATKRSYKDSGKVQLVHSELRKAYSFLDYIKGGTELACTISIDFTASNGNPRNSDSLHYIAHAAHSNPHFPPTLNQYELAIQSVGDIIEDYDSDKLFPVLGFGARLPPDGRVSHEFYVNMHPSNPYCQGMAGVLAAYKACIGQIQLYGPTNFAPTIRHVANIARQFTDGSQYFILLILTDGVISDMPQTKTAIVDAANLPLSIIIVGVGTADFEAMEELDGDTVRLTAPDGRVAARDIVQFVPFRDFLQQYGGGGGGQFHGSGVNSAMARLQLAKEVLAEVPDQFLGFMKANKIVPKFPSKQVDLPPDPEMGLGSELDQLSQATGGTGRF